MKKLTVTVEISTKNRYFSTLPLVLSAILNQTRKVDKIVLYSDGDVDFENNELYKCIFGTCIDKQIKFCIIYSNGKGPIRNHQTTIEMATTDLIWRVDDDKIPESTVLDVLLTEFLDDRVGAVGGLVMLPGYHDISYNASSKIEHFFRDENVQWYLNTTWQEVDHLFSSFVYRVCAAQHGYCLDLTCGFGEETMFTYEMRRNGWKLIVNPGALTWHYCVKDGSIRNKFKDINDRMMHDALIFQNKLKEWNIVPDPKFFQPPPK